MLQLSYSPLDSVLNDAMRIVTGCLRLTPMDYLQILVVIQPVELRRHGATLSCIPQSDGSQNLLHKLIVGSITAYKEKLRSRHSFVPAACKLLNELPKRSI